MHPRTCVFATSPARLFASATGIGFVLCLLFAICLLPAALFSQTTQQTSFGKNRVQYHRHFDEWVLYETSNFVTYWYGDARNVAQATLQMAEYDYGTVQQLLEHQMTDKIEVLVFSDLSDLKQSNIGEEEVFHLHAGETKVVGNKVFVYFNGDHHHLRAQVREGMAGVLLNSMLFGSNLQEIVQNAVLLNLPPWYTEGLTAYCGEEWSVTLDDQLRDLLASKRYPTFDKLAKDHPRLAGHAFWHYIGLHFGKGTISNLLYLTRINRSVDAGFLYVLGGGYRRTSESLMTYYRERYEDEARITRQPDAAGQVSFKNKKNLPVLQPKVSLDGRRVAWVTNDIGRWKVWVKDLSTPNAKRRLVLKGGQRNALQTTDYNYPLLAWHPDNQRLAVIYERRDVARIAVVDLTTGKKEREDLSPEYQRVYSVDYVSPTDLVFAAESRGFGDLFIYHTITRQTERITQDFWDDLDVSAATLDGRRGVLFASNRASDTLSPQRLDTILPLRHFDIFWYDLEAHGSTLVRITNTLLADERMPSGLDSSHYTYLSDTGGIVNRQAGYLEPYIAFYKTIFYLKDGSEVSSLDMQQQGEWPQSRALALLAPADTVRKNLDSTQIDSVRSFAVWQKKPVTWHQTNYDRNILEQHAAPRAGRLAETVRRGGKTALYLRNIEPKATAPVRITRYRELTLRQAGLPIPEGSDASAPSGEANPASTDTLGKVRSDTVRVMQPGWLFQVPDYLATSPPPRPATQAPPRPAPTKPSDLENQHATTLDSMLLVPKRTQNRPLLEFGQNGSIIRFNSSQIVPYRLHFRTDYISTSMDNNLLFEGLESYAGNPDGFNTPPPGILLKANFKDLLEDYVLEAGFRLPTTFNGTEYYLWFDDKKRRLDKRIALYRKSIVNALDNSASGGLAPPVQVRTTTLLGQYEVRYPLDVFTSLRGTFTLRQDKADSLTTDRVTLEAAPHNEQRAAFKLAAVYDNTVDIDLNIRTGTRAKLYVEAVKRFDFNTEPRWDLKFNKGFMTIVGLDARHYLPIDRRSILAFRLAGATTFGSERILYFLGGVDNWLFPQFNNNIPVPQDEDFAYQTLAANLRGFKQNIRNGSSYALFNTELRVPIFKYFSKKPTLGNFWRNFELIAFFDAGTAWQGKNPYRGDNPLNTVPYQYPDEPGVPPIVTVNVNYFRDPLVAGYGLGVRATVFGMFLRADYGWGIETRVVQKPILHLALGADF